jgi:serine phosphatase RsbU (regulator of sigma subunit)
MARFGIKQKFVGLAVLLLFAVAAFTFVFFPYRQQQQMSEYLTQKIFVISDMVAQSTTSALLFDDRTAAKTYLDILKSLDEVQFTMLYKYDMMDGSLKTFGEYRPDNSKSYRQNVDEMLKNKDRTSVDLDNITIAAVPVVSDNETIGRVIVGVTRQNLKADVARSRVIASIVSLCMLAVGSMIFLLQTNRIVSPLLSLERASRKVSEGDMNVEVKATTNDEVGVLANAFNVMVTNVRTSIEEIRNKNTALIMQQELIEQFNKRLTDSIQYAQRIQSSILPSTEVMYKYLPQHFVVFKPKDVVSGDFFWFSHINNRSIIAVVDCTGHGVPGAFMSMIGNTLLNEIVNQKHITDPSAILTELNTSVRLALKQEGESMLSKDGMDVCIAAIEGTTIHFAGAKNPMFVAYNNEVERIAGDKFSIGGHQREGTMFTTKQVTIKSGMSIYLTSDGFIDQSNRETKKLGTRRFTELVKEAHALDTNKQRAYFVKALYEHQGGEDQRDDITLVGIRFA